MFEIFDEIAMYRKALGYPPAPRSLEHQMQMFRDLNLALVNETQELLDAMPWKPWRPEEYDERDLENLAEELVDCVFFIQGIAQLFGITTPQMNRAFERKLAENYRRIQEGYNKPANEM